MRFVSTQMGDHLERPGATGVKKKKKSIQIIYRYNNENIGLKLSNNVIIMSYKHQIIFHKYLQLTPHKR